jgi:hypothetical protein
MKIYFYLSILFLLTGCASMYNTANPVYSVEVDAYGDDSYLRGKKYVLVPSDSTIDENDLQYIEFSKYVKVMLYKKGYIETVIEDGDADVMIFFKYGISDPETFQKTVAVPQWGQTGVSSTTTRGNVYVNPFTNNVKYNQTTTSMPTYGITGYINQTQTYTKYLRYILLTTYDLNFYIKNKKDKIVWNTIITSSGTGGDLRKIIPYMVYAGGLYFGKSSGEKKMMRIYEDYEQIKLLKEFSAHYQ